MMLSRQSSRLMPVVAGFEVRLGVVGASPSLREIRFYGSFTLPI